MKYNRLNGWLKVLLILFTINCSLFTATAQQTDFQQACTRFKNFKWLPTWLVSQPMRDATNCS